MSDAVDIAAEVTKALCARVEREIAEAMAASEDVAVSGFEWDGETRSITAKVLRLKPGEMPPPGRSWTVYLSSGVDPRWATERRP